MLIVLSQSVLTICLGPAQKQWAVLKVGLLGPLEKNTARHGRIYQTAAKHRPAAAAVRRFGGAGGK